MPEEQLKVICAWCGKTIRKGRGPISHGMCPKCERTMEEELNAKAKTKRWSRDFHDPT